jgi:hypothetical protein
MLSSRGYRHLYAARPSCLESPRRGRDAGWRGLENLSALQSWVPLTFPRALGAVMVGISDLGTTGDYARLTTRVSRADSFSRSECRAPKPVLRGGR